jgi:hypothetical protein
VGPLLFAFGSALGAALAWFAGLDRRSRSTGFALNGIACGLLGALTWLSRGTHVPAAEVGYGLLSTAAPLTLCVTDLRAVAGLAEMSAVVRRFAATLALALVSGISCATLGFVSMEGASQISTKVNEGKSADHPIVRSLQGWQAPGAVSSRRL